MHQHDQLGFLARLERGLHRGRLDEILPHSASTRWTLAPMRSAQSAARVPNTPLTPTTTSSPSSTRLAIGRLHPRRTGSRHRKGDFVIGAEDDAQELLDILHQRHIFRVEMAQHRRRHRL